MIDFHNHVLPALDDGSRSMGMTLNMLKKASSQGITTIVNTVHFQHPKMEGKNTDYEYIKKLRDQVVEIAESKNIEIEIKLAAEVYYLPNLCKLIDNPLLTINDYMLIEFPMTITPENYLDTFFNLKVKGITPILAHPERYRVFQTNIDELDKCIDMGVVLQLDAGSLVGHFGKKTKDVAFAMLSRGYCHIIGSDAHNDIKRNFCLKEVYDLVASYDAHAVSTLTKNSQALVDNEGAMVEVKVDLNKSFFKSLKDKFKFT